MEKLMVTHPEEKVVCSVNTSGSEVSEDRKKRKKKILEEDEYVDVLEHIIERDFYPDLSELKAQRLWLKALDTNDPEVIQDTRRKIQLFQQRNGKYRHLSSLKGDKLCSARKTCTEVIEEPTSSSWEKTPERQPLLEERNSEVDSETNEEFSDVPQKEHLTLNKFVASHTSEDNAAFSKILEKDRKDHLRKYHWAFEEPSSDPNDKEKYTSKLLLLPNGTKMSTERRRIMDKACESKPEMEDNRQAVLDTWKFRAQNPLLFPPSYETNRDICKIPSSDKPVLLLENDKSRKKGDRTSDPQKAPTETVYSNSRFPKPKFDLSRVSKVEVKSDPIENNLLSERRGYKMVSMTPSPAPGVEASPFMTWGDIEATPMILDSQTPLVTSHSSSAGPSFEIQQTSSREKLAHKLEASSRFSRRNKLKRKASPYPNREGQSSKVRHTSDLTPAAQSFAQKMSSTRHFGGFGNDLRESYTPKRSKSKLKSRSKV